jgi:exopolysaccharide biosynthesis polyprenyl glycosylphosphotransferase
MFTRKNKVLGVMLGLSDLVVVAIAFQMAYLIRARLPNLRPFFLTSLTEIGLLVTALAIWWFSGAAVGAYKHVDFPDSLRVIKNTVKQSALASLILAGLLFLLKEDISRGFILIFGGLAPVLLLVYRLLGRRMHRLLRRDLSGQCNYVIVGTSPQALEMARMICGGAEMGNRILAFLRERPDAQLLAGDLPGSYPLRDLSDLSGMLKDHVVDEVIFAVSLQDLELMAEPLLACEEEGVKIRVLVNFLPTLIHSEVYLEKLQSTPLLTFSATPENEYLLFVKRLFDVAFSAFLLVVLSPFFLLIALLVRLTSRGPAFYSQVRCGLNGRRFRLYKFRSMYKNADQQLAAVQHLNEMDGPAFKSSRDPRMTPLGRFLRRMSIDEWPQFWNIFKGEMSFVGPRPPVPEEVEKYERWQRRRLRMKPGLTCLWALEGRNQLDFRRWMRLDIDYIEQWSLLLDFKILCLTIPRVLSGRGAS